MYPALAVLQAKNLLESDSSSPVLWVGGAGGMEVDLVTRAGIPFQTIPAAGLHGVGLKALPGNLVRIAQGFRRSRQILREFQPDVALFTGGFVAAPVALAIRTIARRPKIYLYVPDIEPGLALKSLGRLADRIAVTARESIPFFTNPKRVVVTGYPTRAELARWDRKDAQAALELDPALPTLLVFGGSKGARSINLARLASLTELLAEMQIVHISGSLDWETVSTARLSLPENLRSRYHAYPYLHETMGAALSAADLVVSRAGASSLGEFPLFSLPAVLVPYPYAWRYQKVNAEHLANQGAAVLLEDHRLQGELAGTVLALMHDGGRRAGMASAMAALQKPDAARAIVQDLLDLSLAQRSA